MHSCVRLSPDSQTPLFSYFLILLQLVRPLNVRCAGRRSQAQPSALSTSFFILTASVAVFAMYLSIHREIFYFLCRNSLLSQRNFTLESLPTLAWPTRRSWFIIFAFSSQAPLSRSLFVEHAGRAFCEGCDAKVNGG